MGNKFLKLVLVIGLVPTTIFYISVIPGLLFSVLITGFSPSFLFYLVGGGYGLFSTWALGIKHLRNRLINKPVSIAWIVGNLVTLLVGIYYFSQFVIGLTPPGTASVLPRSISSIFYHGVVSVFPIVSTLIASYFLSKTEQKNKSSLGIYSFKISLLILIISIPYLSVLYYQQAVFVKSIHDASQIKDYKYIELPGLSKIEHASFYDSGNIATISDQNLVHLWNISENSAIQLEKNKCASEVMAINTDATKIASKSEDKNSVVICDSKTGEVVDVLSGHCRQKFGCDIDSVVFSPDGTKIATVSDNKILRIWREGKDVPVYIDGHCETQDILCSVTDVKFNHDATYLVTSSSDHLAKIWNTDSGILKNELVGHCGQFRSCRINGATFSPDSTLVVTWSSDRTARIWSVETGKQVVVQLAHEDKVFSAEFSKNGLRVATAGWDNTVRVWDTNSGVQIAVINGGPCAIPSQNSCDMMHASFNEDGSRVLTVSRANSPRIWDANNGELLATLGGGPSTPFGASYNFDGSSVLTVARAAVRVWEITD